MSLEGRKAADKRRKKAVDDDFDGWDDMVREKLKGNASGKKRG